MRPLFAVLILCAPSIALAQSNEAASLPWLAVSAAPLLIVFASCFAKILLTLLFLRAGLSSPGIPPSSFLVALALALSALVMAPVAQEIFSLPEGQVLLQALSDGDLSQSFSVAGTALAPLQRFLVEHTNPDDLLLLQGLARKLSAQSDLLVQIPAFLISELRSAFQLGLWVLLPFLVVDLSLGALLYGLGITQIEPRVIALPIKLMLLISTNGVALIAQTLLLSYAS